MSFVVSFTKMSEKRKEKFQKLKRKIQENENAIQQLQSRSERTCVSCNSKNTMLIYCTSCGSIPICKQHFRNRPRTRQCPLCGQPSLTRRWAIPFPK